MELTAVQREIVESSLPQIVMAGPGTGKTSMLVAKLARMLGAGIKPESILAVTFSRSAANRIREVMSQMGVPESVIANVKVHTVHSFSREVIRLGRGFFGERLGGQKVGIFSLSEFDKTRAMLLKSPQAAWLKQVAPQAFEILSKSESAYLFDSVFPTGRAFVLSALKSASAPSGMTFADLPEWVRYVWTSVSGANESDAMSALMSLAVDGYYAREGVFAINATPHLAGYLAYCLPGAYDLLGGQTAFVLYDEYQDTSALDQFVIGEILRRNNYQIAAFGDPFQTIYQFRGAEGAMAFESLRAELQQRFPDRKLVWHVVENHRNPPDLVRLSRQFLSAALGDRAMKPTQSAMALEFASALFKSAPRDAAATSVYVFPHKTIEEEAQMVARAIQQICGESGAAYSDFAVMYPDELYRGEIEKQFVAKGIPFTARENRGIQAEVFKALYALAAISTDRVDEWDLQRLSALCGCRDAFLQFHQNADGFEDYLPRLLDWLDKDPTTEKSRFANLIRGALALSNISADGWLSCVQSDPRIDFEWLKARALSRSPEVAPHFDQYMELFRRQAKLMSLAGFAGWLYEAIKEGDLADGSVKQRVHLLSLSAMKGLEFDFVFWCGMSRALNNAVQPENLYYVALTRARRSLVITYSNEGTGQATSAIVSLLGNLLRPRVMQTLREKSEAMRALVAVSQKGGVRL